jgi:hypothetical protein
MNIDTTALREQIHEYIEGQKRDAWARITTPMEKSVEAVTRIAEQWETEKSKLLGDLEKAEKTFEGILKRIGK